MKCQPSPPQRPLWVGGRRQLTLQTAKDLAELSLIYLVIGSAY